MRQWRFILSDRGTGGVLATLVAVMALMQLFVGGMALGATASASGTEIICSANGEHGPQHVPGGNRSPWDCVLLCQTSQHLAAAPLAPVPGAATLLRLALAVELPLLVRIGSSRGDVGLHHNAQAPPLAL